MQRKLVRMTDVLTVRSKDIVESKKVVDQDSKGPSLLVRVAATHGGIVNGNSRFYCPDYMQASVHSWTPAKPRAARPILIGHNEDGEVVGRVMDARYIDESYKYKNEYQQIRDSAFYATDSRKKLDRFKSIDWVVDNLMKREDYSGLGYIELGLKVTKPEAIEKVLRDEFLTVSVGFKTDSAICSICHTDWAVEDRCSHALGDEVEGKKMFLISGNFDYEEVSFVNFPADPFATTISKEMLQDSVKRSFLLGLPQRDQALRLSGLKLTDSMLGADIQLVEDTMPEQNADAMTKEEREAALAEATAAAETATDETQDCGCGSESGECACTVSLDELEEADRAYFEDEEGLYHEIELELDAAVAAGELTQDDVQDKKLSSEKRKSLKSSTFCGPNRSFPVPDCAHVTAARRLIGRAKVSESTKSKILACVSRKASSLGCGGKKDAAEMPAYTDRVVRVAEKVKFEDADGHAKKALSLINELDKHHDAAEPATQQMMRSGVSALIQDWDADWYLEYMKNELSQERDMVILTKEEARLKDEAVASADAKVSEANKSKEAAETKLAIYFRDLKKALAQHIVSVKVVTGAEGFKGLTTDQIKTKIEELAKRHLSSLKDSCTDILSELKEVPVVAAPVVAATDSIDQPVATSEETGRKVNDNVQLAEPPAAASEADAAKEAHEKAQKDFALHMARLAAMTPAERTVYMADRTWKPVPAKKA